MSSPSIRHRRVLIVEPSATFARMVASICERSGAEVEIETTLPDALKRIERRAPDAVITARVLGALPGESIVAALRASPLHEHLAIAILSSDTDRSARFEAARPDRVIARDTGLDAAIMEFLRNAFEAPDAETRVRVLRDSPSEDGGILRGCRVLVVDDMESTRRLLNLLLTRQGADVILTESGDQAAELLASPENRPELVLMDYEMPGMNGEASLRLLRERGYTGPVLLCSGHDDPEFARRAHSSGFTGVLAKTHAHRELHTRCAQAIGAAA